ncbi:MAG TPA: NAD-dependent succinate-semialdehyde dehydrogenase [Planctomycetes bacterium]|nr:NAD-dependent succinate-semialdehyde dehydrogenase [Planctomycetota bacterium]
MKTIRPSDGVQLAAYDEHDGGEVERRLDAAVRAQASWARADFGERAEPLLAVADALEGNAPALAELIANEMGKVVREGEAEVRKCALVCRYYAEHGAEQLRERAIPTEAQESFVAHRPLGAVLAIMPWNFPLWQVFRFAAPALMAGNACLLKHAPNVIGCALEIERLFDAAGLPAGLFQTLLVDVERVGALIADRRVAAVTLTGSTRAGRHVAALAGAALKPTVLELGGSDPYVVLEDADLELAARAGATSRLLNAGQSCIAAKRFIAVDAIREEFTSLLTARFEQARCGDPFDPASTLGPIARRDLRDTLARQVEASIAGGARALVGGEAPGGPGFYYPPTVLDGVEPATPAFEEELFGPVASVLHAVDEAEAIRIANATTYGLGAAVFTRDLDRGRRIALEELQAGSAFVNDFVRSDPRLPFGGIRDSGYGRELSDLGILSFVNHKTVVVAAPPGHHPA